MDKFLTCEDIAARYIIKITTVYDWIKAGKLPALKFGKAYRVRTVDLDAFEKRHIATPEEDNANG